MSGPKFVTANTRTDTMYADNAELVTLREKVTAQAERIAALEAGLKPFAAVTLGRHTNKTLVMASWIRNAAALLAQKDGK